MRNSSSLPSHFEERPLSRETQATLLHCGEIDNSTYSKEEVSQIVSELLLTLEQNARLGDENKFFRKIVLGMLIFTFVLMSALFALCYTAAKLGAQTTVDSTGLLIVNDEGHRVVATDSSASLYQLNSTFVSDDQSPYCIDEMFAGMLKEKVLNGNSVLLQFNGESRGSTVVEQIAPNGMTLDSTLNKVCFSLSNSGTHNRMLCIQESEACMEAHRRKLEGDGDFILSPVIEYNYLGIGYE